MNFSQQNLNFSTITQNFIKEIKNEDKIYTIIEIIVLIFAVFSNSLVISAFFIERNLKTRIHKFILSLSIIDLIAGIIAIPAATFFDDELFKGRQICLSIISTYIILVTISKWIVVAIAVNCFWVNIIEILKKCDLNSYFKCPSNNFEITPVPIGLSCIIGLIIGILPVAGWNRKDSDECKFFSIISQTYIYFYYSTASLIPSAILIILYGLVIYEIHKSKSRRTNRNSDDTTIIRVNSNSSSEISAISKLMSVVLIFIICWTPSFEVYRPMQQTSVIIAHIGLSMNPILYSYRLKEIRNAIIKIFSKRQN
ncbi:hypothetical protein PVAND_016933 [Polypedilum vanderplanki]|uniref:G-protein coupled receptors family 1 profile domain-containing protein n=1 Tax=Polypedilum vanderplanki TaxID=319348 RepID=A0A9J6BHI0_POLVA|nr:hypothetical protein PVAND_016933 [Polypedilum vanderplanki]